MHSCQWIPRVILATLAAATLLPVARASDRRHEFSPEFNAYHRFSDRTRLYLLAATTKADTEDSWENELGVHLDFSIQGSLREWLDLADWARDRSLSLRVGYRQLRAWDGEREGVHERRALLELTVRTQLSNRALILQRFGFDQRERDSGSSQRYRYRFNVEKEFKVGHTAHVPYFQAEFTYDSRYSAWSRQRYQVGSEIALTDQWRLEPYVAFDKDTQPETTYTDRLGITVKFYW